ncbi:MAG: Fic family protein [Candidatus Fimenecus sp.]
MQEKFAMTQKENIEIAKRTLVDAIYKSANLEGIAVTYAQTIDILNNVNVASLKPAEINKVFCLRDAWHYTLDHINDEMNLGFLEDIHALVARADVEYYELGKIRTTDVMISGTAWRPELPDAERLHEEMMEIMKMPGNTDKALTLMLWIMRNQIFRDGNKRVATIAANKILIENGCGIVAVPVELDGIFKQMLVNYYESNDANEIKLFLYEKCVDGLNPVN